MKTVRHCDGPVELNACQVQVESAAETVETLDHTHGREALRVAPEAHRNTEAEIDVLGSHVETLRMRAETAP